jgi:hypothetical protein
MRDSPGFTCFHARKGRGIGQRFAWIALVFQFLLLIVGDDGYWFLPERIVGIFVYHLEDVHRAGGYAVSATITLVRIDGYKKIPRCIFVSVMC